MVAKTPEERRLVARIAAHARWAREADRKAATEAARLAALARWEREVDPDNSLTPEERAVRAEHAKHAHMLKMARASLAARKQQAGR